MIFIRKLMLNDILKLNVIILNNKNIGYSYIQNYSDGKLFQYLFINNSYRRKGYGKMLFEHSLKENTIIYINTYNENIANHLKYRYNFKLCEIIRDDMKIIYNMKFINDKTKTFE